jgi:ribosome-associated heat shock protein Hsp15
LRVTDGAAHQRLDAWLWCARVARARSDCARLVEQGGVRINRQPTDKPHAKLRVGDVLTVAVREDVMVLRVVALGLRRGPAAEARLLYATVLPDTRPLPCTASGMAAYAADG